MSRIQRFFQKLLPPHVAQKLEAESRQWMLRCKRCGGERSDWEAGGIRYGGRGRKHVWLRCDACGQRSNHLLYRVDSATFQPIRLDV